MGIRDNQSGFSVVELAVLVLVVGILGFVGYSVYGHQHDSTDSNQSTASSRPAQTGNTYSSPQITKTSDLDKASATLNQTDPAASNSADTGQLDAQLANF